MKCYRIGGINIGITGADSPVFSERMSPYMSDSHDIAAVISCSVIEPAAPYSGRLIGVSITSQEFLDCGDKYVLQFRGGDRIYAAIEFNKAFTRADCRVCDISRYNGDPIDVRLFKMSGIAYRYIAAYRGRFCIHASAVVCENRAVLFLAPAGTGKSTNAAYWIKNYPNVYILNDDLPVIAYEHGIYQAYGTPWCGKDGLNTNTRVPVGAFLFIKRAPEPSVRRLDVDEARAGMLINMRGTEFPSISCTAYGAACDMAGKILSFEHSFCLSDASAVLAHDTIFGKENFIYGKA